MWKLDAGIEFCRWLEPQLSSAGFHCALGGGTLHNGSSAKDLDVFIYPHYKDRSDYPFDEALSLIASLGIGVLKVQFYKDLKTVFSGVYEDKRIDFFLVL